MYEIERKFLVDKNKVREFINNHSNIVKKNIIQYYIGKNERVRKIIQDNIETYVFTGKNGQGLIREEVEFEITKNEYLENVSKAIGFIEKTRYVVNGLEIDFFKNKDFVLLEKEYSSEEEALNDNSFNDFDFIIKEVTEDISYTNYFLATN